MGKILRVGNLEIGHGRPKICGIVLGNDESEIMEIAEMSNSACCEMIEFRADHYGLVKEIDKVKGLLRRLRRRAQKPMIFTFRTVAEGGNTEISNDYYRQLLTMVAKEGLAELIDVEEAAGDREFVSDLKEFGAYVIVSKHDFARTPTHEEIVENYFRMQDMGADIVKVAYMPNTKKDVLALAAATEDMTGNYSSCPVISISMGHLGMISRVLGEFLESAITFASITKASAPGQINVEGLAQILDLIHDNYRKIFLIGFMGSGKTAVANALNNNYGLKRIDLDAYIEQKVGRSTSEFYTSGGEDFATKESKYLKQILKKNYQVISLGGGIILNNANIELMKERGAIVYLRAKPETIAERVKKDTTRSLLGENMDLEYIRNLQAEREKTCLEIADVVVDTDGKDIDTICKEIVARSGLNM